MALNQKPKTVISNRLQSHNGLASILCTATQPSGTTTSSYMAEWQMHHETGIYEHAN